MKMLPAESAIIQFCAPLSKGSSAVFASWTSLARSRFVTASNSPVFAYPVQRTLSALPPAVGGTTW